MALSKTLGGRGRWLLLLAFTLLGAISWLGLGGASHHLTAGKLYHQLGAPLLRLLAYLGVGLLVGQAIESLGWAAKLGGWVAPVLRWGRLRRESGASFTAAFFSSLAALATSCSPSLFLAAAIARSAPSAFFLLFLASSKYRDAFSSIERLVSISNSTIFIT